MRIEAERYDQNDEVGGEPENRRKIEDERLTMEKGKRDERAVTYSERSPYNTRFYHLGQKKRIILREPDHL